MSTVILRRSQVDAAIFDTDGVVTQTATVHAAAWKRLFDEYLAERVTRGEAPFQPFEIEPDYRLYVDGKPRYEGVESFLAARSVSLPRGTPGDGPELETICGLGNRKDRHFLAAVQKNGVLRYEDATRLVTALRAAGMKCGIFSASRNMELVLRAAGMSHLFDDRIDGVLAERLGLRGKPDPDTLLELTRRLGVNPSRTAVFEDAVAGVRAGRAGGFALVVGVNRAGPPGALLQEGADVEVRDLREVSAAH